MVKAGKKADDRQHRLTLAAEVSRRVQIESVFLVQCEVCRRTPDEQRDRADVKVEHQTTTTPNPEKSSLLVMLHCVVEASGDNRECGLRIEATFAAAYRVNGTEGLDQEHFDAFGEFNGLFNIWPYCREFVQSMTTRMGLPVLTLPVQQPVKRVSEAIRGAGRAAISTTPVAAEPEQPNPNSGSSEDAPERIT